MGLCRVYTIVPKQGRDTGAVFVIEHIAAGACYWQGALAAGSAVRCAQAHAVPVHILQRCHLQVPPVDDQAASLRAFSWIVKFSIGYMQRQSEPCKVSHALGQKHRQYGVHCTAG